MSEQRQAVSITLTPGQVDAVVRAASHVRTPSISALVSRSLGAPAAAVEGQEAEGAQASAPGVADDARGGPAARLPIDHVDPRLSRSLLRGFAILTCFARDGRERGILELADELGMSPSTAHRYALTLVELGLLEQCPQSRKYRPAS